MEARRGMSPKRNAAAEVDKGHGGNHGRGRNQGRLEVECPSTGEKTIQRWRRTLKRWSESHLAVSLFGEEEGDKERATCNRTRMQ